MTEELPPSKKYSRRFMGKTGLIVVFTQHALQRADLRDISVTSIAERLDAVPREIWGKLVEKRKRKQNCRFRNGHMLCIANPTPEGWTVVTVMWG